MPERIKPPTIITGELSIQEEPFEGRNAQKDVNSLLQDLDVHTERDLKPATTAIITAGAEFFSEDVLVERKTGEQLICEKTVVIDGEELILRYSTVFSGIKKELIKIVVSLKCSDKVYNKEKRLSTMSALEEDELARRELVLNTLPSRVKIVGHIACREALEGKGISRGLIYLTNKLIEDIKKRSPQTFDNKETVLISQDVAHSDQHNRSNWTSTMAEELGLKRIAEGATIFEKTF